MQTSVLPAKIYRKGPGRDALDPSTAGDPRSPHDGVPEKPELYEWGHGLPCFLKKTTLSTLESLRKKRTPHKNQETYAGPQSLFPQYKMDLNFMTYCGKKEKICGGKKIFAANFQF